MKLKIGILSLIVGIILTSCSTSNDVVGGNIQKRKYNDGYYVSWGKDIKNKKSNDDKITFSNSEIEHTSSTSNYSETEKKETLSMIENTEEETFTLEIESTKIQNEQNFVPEKRERTISNSLEQRAPKSSFKPGRVHKIVQLKNYNKNTAPSASGIMLVVLVILCFIIPPLAVFIFEGATNRFWIDLILFIIGIAVIGWLLSGISGLALLVSVIYALLIVLSVI